MKKNNQRDEICKSVFLGGSDAEIRYRFTQIWIKYINQSEKNKGQNLLK